MTVVMGAMRVLALRNHKGFTLIELLAVMAIVSVLAGIISVSVAGSGQASRDTQTQQDGTSVESAVANFFGNQQGTKTRNPKVVEIFNQRDIKQVTSNKWPKKFITAAYPTVFPEGSQTAVGNILFLNKDGDLSDLRVRGLLQRFNAIDFDLLSEGGFLTSVPKNASETSRGFHNYLWLLEKTVTTSSTGEVSSRNVAVFKLASVQATEGSEVVDLVYQRLFGGDFVDAIPVASTQTVVTDEDTPANITLVGTDLDTCELTFTIEEGTSHGLLTPITDHDCVTSEVENEPNSDSASVTYVPDLNFNGKGKGSFTYSVIDGNGDDLGTVTVNISVVNDAPIVTLTTLADVEVDEDAPDTVIDVSTAFDDVDIITNDDSLTYTVSFNSDPTLVSTAVEESEFGSLLTLQYLADKNGTVQITVRATDVALDFAEDTFAGTGFGIYAANSAGSNEIYNNFLTANAVFSGGSEIYFKPMPIGGNFWSANTGCTDTDTNGVCDTGFNLDQLPWVNPDGWLSPPTPPSPTAFFLDNFNVADTTNLNLDLATRQAGSTLTPVSYRGESFSNPPPVPFAIGNAKLQLEGGGGTGSAVILHNFVDPVFSAAGGLTMCLTASPTKFLPSPNEPANRFAIAFGQTEIAGGTGFPASNATSDIGFRLTATAGTALVYQKDISTSLGVYDPTVDVTNALGREYQVAVVLGAFSFESGFLVNAQLIVDGNPIGVGGAGIWDLESGTGGQNYISLSAINGGWSVYDLRIVPGTDPTCGA